MKLTAISVKSALADRGISQSDLARRLGVCRDIVNRWCRNGEVFYIDATTGVLMRKTVVVKETKKPVRMRAVNDKNACFLSLLDSM